MVNSIIKTLLVVVIITCLFVGVSAASGTKKVEVKDHDENEVKNKDVIIRHNHDGQEDQHKCRTDDHGECDIDDSVEHGDKGEDENGNNCHVEEASLSLTKTADPLTYSFANDIIHYTYVIKNTGHVNLIEPFKVYDNKFPDALPCTSLNTLLVPGATIRCTASYTVKPLDITAGSITNKAYATANYKLDNYLKTVSSNEDTVTVNLQSGGQIPEFPSITLPIAAVIGLAFFFQHKKKKEQ